MTLYTKALKNHINELIQIKNRFFNMEIIE